MHVEAKKRPWSGPLNFTGAQADQARSHLGPNLALWFVHAFGILPTPLSRVGVCKCACACLSLRAETAQNPAGHVNVTNRNTPCYWQCDPTMRKTVVVDSVSESSDSKGLSPVESRTGPSPKRRCSPLRMEAWRRGGVRRPEDGQIQHPFDLLEPQTESI